MCSPIHLAPAEVRRRTPSPGLRGPREGQSTGQPHLGPAEALPHPPTVPFPPRVPSTAPFAPSRVCSCNVGVYLCLVWQTAC